MTRILALVWQELRAADADPAPWERMLDALDDLSPRVEAVDLGVALVDVTGLEPMWDTERRIAARAVMLTRDVAPLRVRCGIGDNRWTATLAARLARFERDDAPAAFRTLAVEELRDLPLDLLPVDPATRARFVRFGLTTMAQLADLPRSAVGAQFGAIGERLQGLARGHDPRPLAPRRRPERLRAAQAFDPPLEGIGSVGLTLRRLAAELCEALIGRHLAPGRAVLVVRLEDAPALRVEQPFPQPVLEPDWIARLLLTRLEAAARARSCPAPELTAKNPAKSASALPSVATVGNSGTGRGPKLAVSRAPRHIPGTTPGEPASVSRNSNHVTGTGEMGIGERVGSAQNLGKSMNFRLRPAAPPASDPRSSTPIAVGQDRHAVREDRHDEDEPRVEPRVASVELAFDRLADPAMSQLPAFEARAGRWEELRWSLERIRHRFGAGRLWRAELVRATAALPEHRSRLSELNE